MVCLKEKVVWNDWLWIPIWGIFLLLFFINCCDFVVFTEAS